MGVFKKNPIFSVLTVVCLLVFVAGTYLAVSESSKLTTAEKRIKRALSDYKNVQGVDPAPIDANVTASEQNLAQLRAALAGIREDLQKGGRMTISEDGVSVMAGIQQFISEFENKAATHTRINDATGETVDAPVAIRDGFAFGFDQYADEATIPEDAAAIPLLDKQRQILTYILDKLLESDPYSIQSVERELVEVTEAKPGVATGFQVDPAVTARVPGAIDTMAFRITYTGYTASLRDFLNYLAAFDMPIVVRSIDVSRPNAAAAGGKAVAAGKASGSTLDGLFGAPVAPKPKVSAKTAVVEDNASSFTLVLEFIEVVLPSENPEPQGEADAS